MKRRSSQARPKTDGVTVDDCRVRLQTGQPVTFVDARRHEDWAAADQMVRGAVRLGPGDGRSYLPDPKRGYIVVYCGWPGEASSTRVVHQLRQEGYRSAYVLKGGFAAWVAADGPLAPRSA